MIVILNHGILNYALDTGLEVPLAMKWSEGGSKTSGRHIKMRKGEFFKNLKYL